MATKTRTKTIRAEVSPELHREYEIERIRRGETRQQFLTRVVKFYLAAASRAGKLEQKTEELLIRVRLTTRQLARVNQLTSVVPGCKLEVDRLRGKRDLLYPLSMDKVVQAFRASCPTGGKKQSGVGASSSGRSTHYYTQERRILDACVVILKDQVVPMSIENLHNRLKAGGHKIKEFSAKATIRNYLTGSPLFDFDSISDSVCMAQETVEPPTVEDAILEFEKEEELAASKEESLKSSLPSFFPKDSFYRR